MAAIVTLTSRHGIRCVAEGVETEQQARTLLDQGCRFGQGFLFSPPLLPSDVEQMLLGARGLSRGRQGARETGTAEATVKRRVRPPSASGPGRGATFQRAPRGARPGRGRNEGGDDRGNLRGLLREVP